MAFNQQASLKGFDRVFSVSPEARPYTLRDNGFVNTNKGNFQYKRSLKTDNAQGLVFKVMIDEDLKTLKMSTASEKGFKTIDVTQLNNNEVIIEKINFILDGFVERHVLIEHNA